MNKGLVSSLLLVLLISTPGYGKVCPDPGCDDPVSEEIRKVAERLETEYGQMARETIYRDKSWLESCLDGINIFQGVGFSLNLPSLDDLMNKVCQAASDAVNKRLDELKGKYTYTALGGMLGIEGSYTQGVSSTVNVKDISGTVVDRLGNRIDSVLK